jgi:hypothetical protein
LWHIASSRVRSIFYLGWFTRAVTAKSGRLRLQVGQRPAPPGELPGDRHVGDAGVLASLVESHPPLVQSPVRHARAPSPPDLPPATVPASLLRGCCRPGGGAQADSTSRRRTCPLPALVIDPCRRVSPQESLRGHHSDVDADRRPGEPGPVADLDSQTHRGQGGDPTQAIEPGDDVAVRVGLRLPTRNGSAPHLYRRNCTPRHGSIHRPHNRK